MSAVACTISERGNGFPDVGDYVPGDDGELYRIVEFHGPIHTGQAGSGTANYIHASIVLADWDDVTDEEADSFVGQAVVEVTP